MSEFYRGKEYNEIKEYKEFPAEVYVKLENKTLTENKKIEETYEESKVKKKREQKKAFSLKDNLKNITKSYGTVAGGVGVTAAVAVVAVVATSNLMLPPPSLDVDVMFGADFVSYHLEIDDLQQDVDYYLSVSNPKHSFVVDIDENKETEIITGLLPEHEYKFSIKGKNDIIGDITYYEKVFQTYSEDVVSAGFSTYQYFHPSDGYGIEYTAYVSNLNESPEYFMFEISDMNDLVWYEDDNLEDWYFNGYSMGLPLEPLRANVVAFDGDYEKRVVSSYVIAPPTNNEIQSYLNDFFMDVEEFTVEWNTDEEHHTIEIPMMFEFNPYAGVAIDIVLYDEKGSVVATHAVNDAYEQYVTVPSSVKKVRGEIVIYTGDDYRRKIATIPYQGELDLSAPEIKIRSMKLMGYNYYNIEYELISPFGDIDYYNYINLYAENSAGQIAYAQDNLYRKTKRGMLELGLENIDIQSMYATINMKGAYGGNERVVTVPINIPKLSKVVEISSFYVSKWEGSQDIIFKLNVAGYDDLTFVLENSSGVETQLIAEDTVVFALNSDEEVDYRYYITNADGEIIVDAKTFTIDPSVSEGEYDINFLNPGEVIITHNKDGSYNAYFITNFESNDDTYYKISIDNNFIERDFTTPVASVENLLGMCDIRYMVCKKVNGVEYVFNENYPSGTLIHEYYGGDLVVGKNTEEEYVYLDVSLITLAEGSEVLIVASNGEEIIFNADEIAGETEIIIPFREIPDKINVYYRERMNADMLDELKERVPDFKGLYEIENEEEFILS